MLNHNRTILVVDGLNCISSYFVEYLVSKYNRDRIVVLDNVRTDNLKSVSDKIAFEYLDVNDNKITKLFDTYKFDIVVSFIESTKIKQLCSSFDIRYLLILPWYKKLENVDTIIRMSHCYCERNDSQCVLQKMIADALMQNYIFVKNDGLIIRNWVNVIDCCRAIDSLLDFGKITQDYIIKSNFEISDRDVARMILKKLELPTSFVEYQDAIELQYDFTNDCDNLVPQWQSKINFEDGLNSLIKWMKKQMLLV